MTKIYELPNEKRVMADVDEKHHTATVSVYILDDLVKAVNKTGHWISGICDNCGYDWGKDAPIASVLNFCPNCGCRMVESQEREEI